MEKITKESELHIQDDLKEIEEIQRKIKNNDYNQLKEVHHDKMVLENREMILKNKIHSKQLYDELKTQNKILIENNSVLIEIIKELSKNKEINPILLEKIKNLKNF
ncbi:MAG: hypothetical protein KGZ34_04420 [Nitrosarchaeum sp.]|nr:hypothetical protein [Nitrosarchaeum sp.]